MLPYAKPAPRGDRHSARFTVDSPAHGACLLRGDLGPGDADISANELLVGYDGRSVYNDLFSGVFWNDNDLSFADIDHTEYQLGERRDIVELSSQLRLAVGPRQELILRADLAVATTRFGPTDRDSASSVELFGNDLLDPQHTVFPPFLTARRASWRALPASA